MLTQITDAVCSAIAGQVGNLAGALLDYSFGLVVNIICLCWKAKEVDEVMKELQHRREDLRHTAEADARSTQADVSDQLSGWMSRVSNLAEDASKFQRSYDHGSTCICRICLGYDTVKLLRKARKLAEEGNIFSGGAPQLIRPRGPDPVEQVPSETSSSTLAGGREALERVQRHIMDDGVGIIGIYGMGGVGKTTLLKLINNEFLMGETYRDKFDVAIWVTVSRDVQISSIRETVAGRLGLPSNTSKNELFRQLSKKRFILLLDDVWEKLNLTEIGIPLPRISNDKNKILFTTRYQQVCGDMHANETVKINSLDVESSRELFRSKLGWEAVAAVLHDQSIRGLAEEVMEKCGGLPIALITVGTAMFNANTKPQWKDAKRKLDQCAAELSPGMEEVLTSLKFSFDMLKDEAHRNCLLYCALFPEDYKILKEEIIDMWICEGFLDAEDFDEDNIEETRCRGNVLVSELQDACLLEETFRDTFGRERVMLHDTVRDMALWIAGHDFVVLTGSSSQFFLTNASSSQLFPKSNIWENAKKISLIYNHEIKPSSSHRKQLSCPNLTTLLLQRHGQHTQFFTKNFLSFTSMPALRVLDLDYVGLSEFPIGITLLASLEYLSLSGHDFPSLPVELGNLTNLRILILRFTHRLTSIPAEAISRLSRLQVLDMIGSAYRFGDFNTRRHPQPLELSDLANLERLSELHLPELCSWASLGVIADSPVLPRSTRELFINVSVSPSESPLPKWDTISEQIGKLSELRGLGFCPNPSDPVMGELQLYPISQLQNLKYLYIEHFREAKFFINNISSHGFGSESLFPRLRELWIKNCDGCSELTWVGRLPCLEKLILCGCQGLREVMLPLDGASAHNHMPSSFPKLKSMTLFLLPSLRSISTSTLLFPCLERLYVDGCPRLQRLPFGPQSAKNLQSIDGPRAWWDGLEWDDVAHQQSFSSKFWDWQRSNWQRAQTGYSSYHLINYYYNFSVFHES